jgi:hypothetical protein
VLCGPCARSNYGRCHQRHVLGVSRRFLLSRSASLQRIERSRKIQHHRRGALCLPGVPAGSYLRRRSKRHGQDWLVGGHVEDRWSCGVALFRPAESARQPIPDVSWWLPDQQPVLSGLTSDCDTVMPGIVRHVQMVRCKPGACGEGACTAGRSGTMCGKCSQGTGDELGR